MAAVPEDAGIPSIGPQIGVPDNYQHVQAGPEAFGAGIGQGLGQIGTAVGKAEQSGLEIMDFYDHVASDQAKNHYNAERTRILYGDPNKPVVNSDGTTAPDTGYFGLTGAAAMTARPQVMADLDKAAKDAGSSLRPNGQRIYGDYVASTLPETAESVGRHATQQQNVWAKSVNEASATLALNTLAARPNDPIVRATALQGVLGAYIKAAQIDGTDPRLATLRAQQDVALTRVQSVMAKDPVAAQRILDENTGLLASLPQYPALERSLNTQVNGIKANTIADGVLLRGSPAAGPAPRAEDVAPHLKSAFPGLVVTGMGRTPAQNASVNGVPNSAHLQDHALDIRPAPGLSVDVLQKQMATLGLPDAKVIYEGPGAKNSTAPHFHIQWGADASPPASGPPQSEADYYRTHYTEKLAEAETAARDAGLDDTGVLLARSRAEQRMNDAIRQQELSYKADSDTVYGAANGSMTNGKLPTSIDALTAISPDVRTAWANMQRDNPDAALALQTRLITANTSGAALGYGRQFYELFQQVMLPENDPKRMHDGTKLFNYVGKGEDAPLTNTGLAALQGALAMRNTPQGNAIARQEQEFFRNARHQLTLTNDANHTVDRTGDVQFNHFMVAATSRINAELKSGKTPEQLFDPKSPDYVGKLIPSFDRPLAQKTAAILAAAGNMSLGDLSAATQGGTANSGGQPIDVSTPAGLKAAVQAGAITREQGAALAVKNGWIAAPPPPIPTPH